MSHMKGAMLVSDPATGEPYALASEYLALSLRAALAAAADDPSGYRWRDAIFALGIAQLGLPPTATSPGESPLPCLDLILAARDVLIAVPVSERAVEHLVSLAYLQDALEAVDAAAADRATEA